MITKGNPIDLSKPIFVYYLGTTNRAMQKVQQMVQEIYLYFPSNINLWVVPIEGDSRIECVYNGLVNINQIRQILDLIEKTDSTNFSELKSEIRELLLSQLLNEQEQI
jgi:hypothetical protein